MKKLIHKVFNSLGFEIKRVGEAKLQDRKYSFRPYFIEKNVEGVDFKFFVGDTDGMEWYHTGATDPVWIEMRFIKDKIISEGDTVVECGSHHGCTTVVLSDWVGKKGRVLSFEPNPVNFEILKINLSINGIQNVEPFNIAVGAENGEVDIDISSSNSYVLRNTVSVKTSKVKLINIDSLLDSNPDVLKIDVEGFEKEVLAGAVKLLRKKPKLAIEIHPEMFEKYNTSIKEIFDIINRDNYNFWVQWDDEKQPCPYNFEKEINSRVHLFAIPK